jgi:hypothetical protein
MEITSLLIMNYSAINAEETTETAEEKFVILIKISEVGKKKGRGKAEKTMDN